ncbi:MAG: tetratricopeptide repeat protein [Treponema sp.]|nr:tetratricopeptide repeat protein [Treponema sp.]
MKKAILLFIFAAALPLFFMSCVSTSKQEQHVVQEVHANDAQAFASEAEMPQSHVLSEENAVKSSSRDSSIAMLDDAQMSPERDASATQKHEESLLSETARDEDVPASEEKTVSPKLAFMQHFQELLNNGDVSGALSCFDDMQEELRSDKELQIIHASLLVSDGQIKQAQHVASSLLADDGDNVEVLELNAYLASITNSKNRDSLIKQLLQIDPYNVQANILQAQLHFAKHRYKLANNSYKNALQKESDNIDALFGYGQTMFYMNEPGIDELQEAENAFNKILELDETHALALAYLGKIAAENKNYLRAAKYIQQAIAVDNANYDFYMDLGTYMRYLGKLSDAEDAWTHAIALEPTYFLAYTYRAGLYKEQKKYKEALADLNNVIATNPKYYYAYEDIGVLEWHEQHWGKSREAFQKAYAVDKRSSYVLMIAATYLKEKKIVDCKKFLAQAMRNFERTSVEYEMMRLYHDQGGANAENSIRLKLDKIEKPAERGRMWFYMGLFYELIGSARASNEYYTKVTNMNAPLFFEYEIAEWSVTK